MADVYVWSGATGAANGTSFTDAYTRLDTGCTNAASGDRVLVAHDHLETYTSNTAYSVDVASKTIQIIVVDRTTEDAVATYGASGNGEINNTGGNGASVTFSGNGETYIHGLRIICDGQLNMATTNDSRKYFSHCYFSNTNSSTSYGHNASGYNSLVNCIKCDFDRSIAATLRFRGGVSSRFVFIGCKFLNTADSSLLQTSGNSSCYYELDGCDLSALGSNALIVESAGGGLQVPRAILGRCLMPTGWVLPSSVDPSQIIEAYQCADAETTDWIESISMRIHRGSGSIREETGITRNGGASADGTNLYSLKVDTNASAISRAAPIRFPLATLNLDISTAKTITVHLIHDSLTNLTNADAWIEVVYSDDTTAKGHFQSTFPGIKAAATDLSSSSETWNGSGGLTNPNKQQISLSTAETGKLGPVTVTLAVSKPSYSIYVDPKVVVS